MRIMSTRLLCFIGVLSLGSASTASAQALPYKFVRIADTVNNPDARIDGLYCVGLNNTGTVVIQNSQNVLWRGTGGLLEMVSASAHSSSDHRRPLRRPAVRPAPSECRPDRAR